MNKLRDYLWRFRDEIFALVGMIVVLWQMLLPWYVLLLDLTWGPIRHFTTQDHFLNTLPIDALLAFVQQFVVGWVVEKGVLILLCFALFYIPLRAFPFVSRYGERYVAALFFAINPFVYERLLAGQWLVVAGYCVLPLLLSSLYHATHNTSWRRILLPFVWLFAIGLFSLHTLVMGCILYAIFFFAVLASKLVAHDAQTKAFLLRSIAGGALFVAVSMYWIAPYVLHPAAAPINGFDATQWDAFRTTGAPYIGVLGNVLILYGFWGEHEAWAGQYVWPALLQGAVWYVSLALFFVPIFVGIVAGLRSRTTRRFTALLLILAACAVVFSVGLGGGVLYEFNAWLFAHVWFWKGFRDTQKWSGVVATIYALLAGLGAGYIVQKTRVHLQKFVLVALCLVPFAYTPTLLFGLVGQVSPVWYPVSWAQVNTVLAKDSHCKALFLPWHEYYSLTFNHDVSTANLATNYFDCTIGSAQNIEMDSAGTPGGLSDEYYKTDAIVTDNASNPDSVLQELRKQGFTYIIYTPDVRGIDQYHYPVLESKKLVRVIHNAKIDLYRVEL